MTLVNDVKKIGIILQGPRGPRGANWMGVWSALTTYQPSDVVRLSPGGDLYYALTASTNLQPDLNPAAWELFLPAGAVATLPGGTFVYTSAWSALTTYAVGAVVYYGGVLYLATAPSLNQTPPNPLYWLPFTGAGAGSGAVVYRGDWSGSVTYALNDWVRYANALYRLKVSSSLNDQPTNPAIWELVLTENFSGESAGFNWKDPVGTVADLPGVGNGIGDARMVLAPTPTAYVWDGAVWAPSGGGGGITSVNGDVGPAVLTPSTVEARVPAQYATVGAAVTAGKRLIAITADTTEAADFEIPVLGLSVFIAAGVYWSLSAATARMLNTTAGAKDVTVHGPGVLVYDHTGQTGKPLVDHTVPGARAGSRLRIINTLFVSSGDGVNCPVTNGNVIVQNSDWSVEGDGNGIANDATATDNRVDGLRLTLVTAGTANDGINAINLTAGTVRGLSLVCNYAVDATALVLGPAVRASQLRLSHGSGGVGKPAITFNGSGLEDVEVDPSSTAAFVLDMSAHPGNAHVSNLQGGLLLELTLDGGGHVLSDIEASVSASSTGALSVSNSELSPIAPATGITISTVDGLWSNVDISGDLTVQGNQCSLSHVRVTGDITVDADRVRLDACQAGTGAGGGAATVSITAASDRTLVIGTKTDAAIVDAGTNTALFGNQVY